MRCELIKSDRPAYGVKLIYENGHDFQSDVSWTFYLFSYNLFYKRHEETTLDPPACIRFIRNNFYIMRYTMPPFKCKNFR